jgi:hypothetical protein
VEDYLALLRKTDEIIANERRQREEEREAKIAKLREWTDAWETVISTIQAIERGPEKLPDFKPFIELAKLIRARGYENWIGEMAEGISKILDDPGMYRPGQLFFLQVMLCALIPGVTSKRLSAVYRGFVPADPPPFWRSNGVKEVCNFMLARIEKAEAARIDNENRIRQAAAEARDAALRVAAKRRPAIEKQIFSAHWNNRGLGPAAIRDKWNVTHPGDRIDTGEAGRDDIKKAIARGNEFLAANDTTVAEMAGILGILLAP